MSKALSLVFAGTPDFAACHLNALLHSRHKVVAVYTQPDRPAGRGKKLQASPVKQLAETHQITVKQPLTLKSDASQIELAQFEADVMIVVAYGLLLPLPVLNTPRLGCLNVHGSLLPRWRGAAPVQRAIEAGDTETGVTLMQMDVGLDTGPMLLTRHCPISSEDTSETLLAKLAHLGTEGLLAILDDLSHHGISPQPQDNSLATYAHKLTKEEARIDWSQPAEVIARKIRAFIPYPVAFTTLNHEPFKILQARAHPMSHTAEPGTLLSTQDALWIACGQQTQLAVLQAQLPGKKALSSRELLNGFGHLLQPGQRLGVL